MRISLASYNIHGCVGLDGRYDRGRILDVLQEMDCDVVALQEVETLREGMDLLAYLAAGTGTTALAGPTMAAGEGHFGPALLTRYPAVEVERLDRTYHRREPRGALGADLDCGGGVRLRAVATHLGLGPRERRFQVRRLLKLFRTPREWPAVLMGDLNEWLLWGRPLRWLHAYFDRSPALRTFPARLPVFALDRILVHPHGSLEAVQVHRTRTARAASDHLPVTAVLRYPEALKVICRNSP
jgi:endonuclease/exonuclease/phosphatase family metal-dependent hydrolase